MSAMPLSVKDLLSALPKPRLVDVGREFGVQIAKPNGVPATASVGHLVESGQLVFRDLLEWMRRDELMEVCKSHGLQPKQRSRGVLSALLLDAHRNETVRPVSVHGALEKRSKPEPGEIARVRQRQYLITGVEEPRNPRHLTRVDLICLDDDQAGRPLSVLWELELGAHAYARAEPPLQFKEVDSPRRFAAYLHALQWSCVSVADQRLQAPFRAGIKLLNHQLTPLLRALEQPTCKLFIADDVGLGKTIEAGLVLQELELRQRLQFTLIVCPAAICLQWQREMELRFGQRFEIYDREFVRQRRLQRGFGINPWSTQQRFIVSYQTLRREEHRAALEQCLKHASVGTGSTKVARSMLVLDEAHTVAPATRESSGSGLTELAGKLTNLFEHHLFLSATPHNGYSGSFAKLLQLLDAERFSGKAVIQAEDEALAAVMVRRLKRDLVQLDRPAQAAGSRRRQAATTATSGQKFPDRHVAKIVLRATGGVLLADFADARGVTIEKCGNVLSELELSRLLKEYTEELSGQGKRGRRTLGNLQKRLMSSIPAFATTLQCHIKSLRNRFGAERFPLQLSAGLPSAAGAASPKRRRKASPDLPANDVEPEIDPEADAAARDAAEDVWDRALDAEVERGAAEFAAPSRRAIELLREMSTLAQRSQAGPDARVRTLAYWLRQHLCPALALGGPKRGARERGWSDERVIIFTEYTTTKNWLKGLLQTAIEGTELADERIVEFHGAMQDWQREYVQKSFNGDPAKYPARILLATDAAREGLNLHRHCKHLFHLDIPWNPARLEQRNGRIDRAFQPSPEVWCHYFSYADREADVVLERVIEKLERTARELPGLTNVVAGRLGAALADGIDESAAQKVDAADATAEEVETESREVEQWTKREAQLRADIESAADAINKSATRMRYSEQALRDAIDVGLELCGIGPLRPVAVKGKGGSREADTFELPPMPPTWERTLDTLREPRKDDEPLWRWRRKPLQPVVFSAPESMDEGRVQLHLRHPFVQRVLARFLSQGFSAHDLNRVTVLPNEEDARELVVVFARATLFARDATRLHDELFGIAAARERTGHVALLAKEEGERVVETALRLLDDPSALEEVPSSVRDLTREHAGRDGAVLWESARDRYQRWLYDKARLAKQQNDAKPDESRGRLAPVGMVYLWPATRM